ncbi:unnamed protein product [Camellia sinensis]
MRIVGFGNVLLLIATLFATITFQVPFHLLGSTSKEGYIQDSIMSHSLMLLNSMVFMASVGIIMFLLHEFPLKPWPHISISALFGSYMFSLKAVSPNEGPALFFISIPILLVVKQENFMAFQAQVFCEHLKLYYLWLFMLL